MTGVPLFLSISELYRQEERYLKLHLKAKRCAEHTPLQGGFKFQKTQISEQIKLPEPIH